MDKQAGHKKDSQGDNKETHLFHIKSK
jgi:hypothetical protein